MAEFTKKLFTFGGSKAIVIPVDLCEYYDLQKGDYVTLEIIATKKAKE